MHPAQHLQDAPRCTAIAKATRTTCKARVHRTRPVGRKVGIFFCHARKINSLRGGIGGGKVSGNELSLREAEKPCAGMREVPISGILAPSRSRPPGKDWPFLHSRLTDLRIIGLRNRLNVERSKYLKNSAEIGVSVCTQRAIWTSLVAYRAWRRRVRAFADRREVYK